MMYRIRYLIQHFFKRFYKNLPLLLQYLLGKAGVGGYNIVVDRHYEIYFTIKNIIKYGNGKKILDIGCSGSYIPIVLSSLGYDIFACDLNEWSIKLPNWKFFCNDFFRLSFDYKMDAIVCISVIEHLNAQAYLKNNENDLDQKMVLKIYDTLRDGGLFIISVPIGESKVIKGSHQVYSSDNFKNLVSGFDIITQSFFMPVRLNPLNYEECTEQEAYNNPFQKKFYSIVCAALKKPYLKNVV